MKWRKNEGQSGKEEVPFTHLIVTLHVLVCPVDYL